MFDHTEHNKVKRLQKGMTGAQRVRMCYKGISLANKNFFEHPGHAGHGAKKIDRKANKQKTKLHRFFIEVNPNLGFENETIIQPGGGYADHIQGLYRDGVYLEDGLQMTSKKLWPASQEDQPIGSSPFHSFEHEPNPTTNTFFDGKPMETAIYPDSRDFWFPFFIKGIRHRSDIDNPNGLAHSFCHHGKFWYANSSERSYNSSTIQNEIQAFNCGVQTACTLGAVGAAQVYFTQSLGGLITMQGFKEQRYFKGPLFVWGASQSSWRGSVCGNAGIWLCSQRFGILKDTDMPNMPGSMQILARGLFWAVWLTLRNMNYCNNKMNGSGYLGALMIGKFDFVNLSNWGNDYAYVSYKYCGTHPGGMLYDIYDDAYDGEQFDITISTNQDAHKNAGNHYKEHHGNDFSLYMLSYWICRFFDFCEQLECKDNNQMCSWRGCNISNCKTNQKSHFVNSKFRWKTDGMVALASCVSQDDSQAQEYYNVDGFGWTGYQPDYLSTWWSVNATGDYEDPNFNPALSNPRVNGAFDPAFIQSMGHAHLTIQYANHEDGTGCNGNSIHMDRAPINWFMNIISLTHAAKGNTTADIANNNIDSEILDTTNALNFVVGTDSDIVDKEARDDNDRLNGDDHYYAIQDLGQSGGSWVN